MDRHPSARPVPRPALVAAALAVALALPASAAERDAPPRALGSRPSTAVPLPPPPPGTHLEHRDATLGLAVGPWVGLKTGSSVALHADYGFLRTPPRWGRLELEVRLGVTVARPSEDTTLYRNVLVPFPPAVVPMEVGVEKTRVWLFEAVPFGRVRLPVAPRLAVFADAGLGLAQTFERYEREETFVGHTTTARNVTGLVLRLGAGASYQASDRVRVLLLPLAFSFQLGPGYGSYAPTLGVAYHM